MTWKIICLILFVWCITWQVKWHARHCGDQYSANAAFDLIAVVGMGITVLSILAYEIIR